ncbi:hypothetical protein [Roseobacter sinensis]|uniref:Uncharacterized protein n=1 Tax=Roseobacter sinensis TaxID=2931391 RepID=A0ABT3BGB5_9RHOB|nr:hypothetical protein [Roseobacter sp. WL0113]MCV3272625.1 hypothetical protein [Roseobacter sp. WL0113]
MPRVVRLYMKSAFTGFFAAGAFVALVLWLNVANLGHLVATSDVAVMAVAVFWVLNGIVFSGVQFAWAITAMAARDDRNDDSGGGPRQAVPVLVASPAPKPRR